VNYITRADVVYLFICFSSFALFFFVEWDILSYCCGNKPVIISSPNLPSHINSNEETKLWISRQLSLKLQYH